jgi:hypothetical protein
MPRREASTTFDDFSSAARLAVLPSVCDTVSVFWPLLPMKFVFSDVARNPLAPSNRTAIRMTARARPGDPTLQRISGR